MFLNEELKVRTDKKLRDAVHDIVTELEENEYYDIGTVSNILRHKYKVFITPNLLERLLNLWDEGKSSVFIDDDSEWLSWDPIEKILENNRRKKRRPGVLGKSRRRLKRKEEEELYNVVRQDGWIKVKGDKFVYRGNISYRTKIDKDKIPISRFEKESYGKNENPITPELIKKVFILNHPSEAEELSNDVGNRLHEIKSDPKDGDQYYFDAWMIMLKIADEMKLDTVSGFDKKYAPVKYKMAVMRRKQRLSYEKYIDRKALKHIIRDRESGIKELSNVIDINKDYFLVSSKYNKQNKTFYLKKMLYGKLTVSDNKYPDGYYKVIMKVNGHDIFYFNSITYVEKAYKTGGLKVGYHIYNLVDSTDISKIKIYMTELKRYKGWDEYLNKDTINKIK